MKELNESQFHTVWTEAVGMEGYNKKLFQDVLKVLKEKGLIINYDLSTGGNSSKNLENKEILSDDILKAIERIITKIPNVVFGGSISLNAVGLLNRKISDIDLFFNKYQNLAENNFLSIVDNQIVSDTVTNTNGEEIQRVGAKVDGVKICCFKVSDEELQSSKYTFRRDGKSFTINIQNINFAIEAKKAYANHNKNPKHIKDLDDIYNEFESFST